MSLEVGLDGYFREAASWDADRLMQARTATRVAWRVAGAGWLLAVLGGMTLLALMPLKRVDSFVVRVDNSTGVVDVVPMYDGRAPADEVVTRYFLTHYISICERFNFATAESDYEECGAFNSVQRNQEWYAQWNPNNPASPLNVHKDGGTVRVQIEAVSFFRRGSGVRDLAQVRYMRIERQGGQGAADKTTHWVATIQYAYGPPSRDPGVRRWNPLGFKVIELTSEPEVQGQGATP